jgi:hypothetical protein
MRPTRLAVGTPACLLVLCFISPGLFAQNAPPPPGAGGLINEALSKPVQMDLNATLQQAMRGIADKTGVRIEADRAVWELLPWGEQTRITVKLDNQPLQGALQAIVRKLGLEYVVRENSVELRPTPALRRLGRRATAVELGALDLLASTPLKLEKNRPTVREVVEAVDQKLLEMKAAYAVEFRTGQEVNPDQAVAVPRNATLADALEELARQTGATWYPWGNDVVIVPKEDQVRNLLQKTVTVRYSNADVGQVLSELSQLSGVDFDIEPGAVQRIPANSRTLKLTLENRTVRQALEDISGFTGLGYAVTKDGVSITNPQPATGAPAAGAQDPVVGMFTVAEGVQVMLRESQVPPDVLEYIRHRRERAVKVLRDQMKAENFTPPPPTTRPAAPAKKDDTL